MGFLGKRKSIPRLDELLPKEERKLESLYEALQTVPCEDDSEDIDTGLLEEAVRKEPHEFIYHYILGTTYFSCGELEKAREILEKASSFKPDDPRPVYNLGVIYYGIWSARTEEQNGKTDEQTYRQIREALNDPSLPADLRRSGEEIVCELEDMMRHPDYERNKRLRDCYRKIPMPRDTAAANALYYFRKVLVCQLHPEDRKAVEGHIGLIETFPRLIGRKLPMKDIDARKVVEWDAFLRKSGVNGTTTRRILELQKVYERYPNVWAWVDATVANVPVVPDLILSFVFFKLLRLLSEANEKKSQGGLKDLEFKHVPFSSPIPKTVRLDTVSLYEWAKKSYPNCIMWYGLSIARDIQEGKTYGGFQSATLIAILVEMLEQANAD